LKKGEGGWGVKTHHLPKKTPTPKIYYFVRPEGGPGGRKGGKGSPLSPLMTPMIMPLLNVLKIYGP